MEILNNHQLVKRNRRVFHYRVNDHSSRNNGKNPANIDYYSIVGNDLILTHENYHDPKYEATDTLRDWRLLNVDMTDCDPEKLSELMDDRVIDEIKIIEIRKGKKLIFSSFAGVYSFKCEEIEQEIRGHSRKEMVNMFLEIEKEFSEICDQNSKICDFVTRLNRFINGETKDYRNVLAMYQDKNIPLATKSMHYLEILTRVKDKLGDLIKDLPEDFLKYHGILS